MSSWVSRTKGFFSAPPETSINMSSLARGATMRRADNNCVLAEASSWTLPPCRPIGERVAGKKLLLDSIRVPCFSSASSNPFIGRLRICSVPSSVNSPPLRVAQNAVRNLAAVPATPTNRDAFSAGMTPVVPSTRILRASSSACTSNPSFFKQSTIWRESSLNKAPVKVTGWSAMHARISMRLVILFEPGTSTTPDTGLVYGLTAKGSAYASAIFFNQLSRSRNCFPCSRSDTIWTMLLFVRADWIRWSSSW